jgi:hypothetical protein
MTWLTAATATETNAALSVDRGRKIFGKIVIVFKGELARSSS